MGLATFRGGVHPYEGKELSESKPVQELTPTSGEMVYPLSQHIGAPAKPLVAKGDYVLAGQKIAEAGGFISANVISSASGTVKAIEPRRVPNGSMAMSIVIENDGEYKMVEGIGEDRDYTKLSKQEIRDIVKEAGIVGLGGAGFPTHVKLTPKDDSKIEYVLVNGAECEPYLTSDYRMMLEEPEKIIGGLKIILQLFENAKGVIGIENNKPEAISKLTEMVKDEPNITVCPLLTKYPQGGERSLIYAITGRKVNSSMLPADAGCVVDNIDTVCAVYRAVMAGEPVMDRIVTVTGEAVADPCNFKAKMGTSFADLLEAAGGFKQPAKKIISGGPMMGFAMVTADAPVTKTSSSILAFKEDAVAKNPETACINCGRCVGACPSRIIPSRLADYALRHNEEAFVAMNGLECVECGSCSYVCPAKRQLKQAIGSMRKTALANKRKK